MNPRIRELIKTKSTILFPGTDTVDCQISDIEKFAELIIRECANITLDYKNHDHHYGWMDHGEEIIRHFGIER
jgi:hypothetical protein